MAGPNLLQRWRAWRERNSSVQASVPVSSGSYGSELYEWLTGYSAQSSAGMVVNERTILCVSAVYACVSLIGGAVASMPLHFYQRTATGREKVDTTSNVRAADLWWLLNEQPHPMLTAAVYWDYLLTAKMLHGDGFAWIKRPTRVSPEVEAILPLHPLDVQVDLDDGQLYYTFHDPEVEGGGAKLITVNQADMLHVPGPGFDGCRGMSLIRYAAKTQAGIALAADENQARFFGNSARPDFAIEHEGGKLTEEAVAALRQTWMDTYGGPTRTGKPVILSGGLKVKPLTMGSRDAEWLGARQFQVVDIARLFGVPPHMIGETDKTSSWGSGVESMSIGFIKYTLQRHLTAIEQELNRKLFPRTTRWFAKFSPDGLLRGDSAARSAYYRAALGGGAGPGWMTQDEVRRLEDLAPIGGAAGELADWKTSSGDAGDSGGAASAPAA